MRPSLFISCIASKSVAGELIRPVKSELEEEVRERARSEAGSVEVGEPDKERVQ